jgi:hypothetical protein
VTRHAEDPFLIGCDRAAIGQTRICCLYQSNSQNFFKFYCHFLGPTRARGLFRSARVSKKF